MRRLNRLAREDRGASAVLIALLMVAIVGVAGLAVDVGGMYWENNQLQNGADAAAVGVAQACARTSNACTGYQSVADSLGSSNANDNLANSLVQFTNGTPSSGEVTVTTSTKTPNGVFIDHKMWDAMMGLLGLPPVSTTEYTKAKAQWGAPTSSTIAIPIAISLCNFTPALDGTRQLIQYANPNGRTTCPTNANYPPGGFGWLSQTQCYATIVDGTVLGDPGNSYPNTCNSTFVQSLVGKTIIVPIFGSVTAGSGQNGQNSYNISGFAAFVITGWRFSGTPGFPQNYADPTLVGTSNDCTGSCRGIQGYFTKWVSIDSVGVTIGSLGTCALGDCVVRLVP